MALDALLLSRSQFAFTVACQVVFPSLAIGLAGGFVCGADTGSPVWDKYKPPFKFTGALHSVTVDVSGELIKDDEAAMRLALARQ